MPLIAFAPDIKGVCRVLGIFEINSNPKKIANIKIKNRSKFIKPWSIAIFKGQKFKGGTEAILHRTPNEALNKKSLLMCLDSEAFS